MRRASILRLASMKSAALTVALTLAAGAAAGQTIDWMAGTEGLTLERGVSARLDGMGGLRITIPDEGYELNFSDYGGLVSGILDDSDGRTWEFFSRGRDKVLDDVDESGLRTRDRASRVQSGGQMAWRSQNKRVLGLDFSLDRIRSTVERGDRHNLNGPYWGGFGAQRVGSLVLGGAIHFRNDNEDLRTEDVFAIRHDGSGQIYDLSATYGTGLLRLGGQAEWQVNTIKGVSRDESRFHEDEMTWKRPISIYSAIALLEPSEKIQGGVRFTNLSLDGREEADISWSDRMPSNPGRVNFRMRAGTFDEEIRDRTIGTRWQIAAARSIRLAVAYDRSHRTENVVEGANFKGSRRALDLTVDSDRVGGGAGWASGDQRLRLGVEGWMLRQKSDQKQVEGNVETTSRSLDLRAGAEWLLRNDFALRAGYVRSVHDDDIDAPRTLRKGDGVTLGAGYFLSLIHI
ncbi:MAG: hypothetical protein QUU85_15300 [Candidatus Eisenbacteria bacterium]|nr:hypothetical protein [Candidatus Eisenbacteria bacterium]